MLALTSPIETPFHRVPAGGKLVFLAVFTVALFQISQLGHMFVPLGFVAGLYVVAGVSFLRLGLMALRPLTIFALVILAWHVVTDDADTGVMLAVRLVASVSLANLVTMTTRLDDMMSVLRSVLRPFERLGLRADILSFAVALAVRFTPVLRDRGRMITEAWRARSPRRPRWNVLVPLTLTAIDDAEQVAQAVKARGGVPRDQHF